MKFKDTPRRRAIEYEKALIDWWKKNEVFEKSVNLRDDAKSYVFYDGPPFITGMPHHGTLLSSIVKDAVPRFWTMRGFRVERRWGWDCHGLPAENFVEKQLGITDRREIGAKWSLEDYILKAKESMVANSETWESTIERVGRWVEFKGAYRTMDKNFMESVWWAFSELYKAGKIYEGRKVLMYDTKFATPVSKAEVTMDNDAYQTVTDPSAYVLFKLTKESEKKLFSNPQTRSKMSYAGSLRSRQEYTFSNSQVEMSSKKVSSSLSFMAWTTTPWTLPANKMLAVNPEMEYGVYGDKIVAVKLAEKVLPGEKASRTFKGAELAGLEYEDLFGRGTHKVFAADFVGDEEGTGIVHIAPAYGEDDYELYLENEAEAEFEDVLDENGYYLPEMAEILYKIGVRDTDENGIECFAANKFIAKVLESAGIVYKIEYIKHEYPFNPRSKQRIMYRAFPSWFFDISGSKELMLSENENVNWFPKHLKHGRFAKNIEAAPDWNLSRDRFFATAMPVWKSDEGDVVVVGSYDELFEFSGVRLEDYHRPWVDEVEFDAIVTDGGEILPEKSGAKGRKAHFKRIEKVLDCWFESGSMPFAQLHYPFENKEKFESRYPADFIVEYVGQVRAWFYYVHAVNTSLASIGAFGEDAKKGPKNAFKNVITTGTLAGNDGRKMSKSLGNYTDPNELMDKYSADSLRFLLLSSPVCSGEDFALIDKDVSDVARKLSMIWNTYDFFKMYAAVDDIDTEDIEKLLSADASARPVVTGAPRSCSVVTSAGRSKVDFSNIFDIWIVSRVHQLRNEITEGMEEYDLPKAVGGILPFVDDLSNWFVRRSRRRFWKSEDDGDKMEAYAALYYVLVYLSKIIAPFVPFLSEELYQNMTGSGESVHLLDWPEAGEIDEDIIAKMGRTREIISEGLKLRMQKSETEEQIKVRQPLSEFTYAGEKLPEEYEKMIAEEVNVKKVVQGTETKLDKTLTDELRAEGFARELIRVIQAARKKAGLSVDDRIRLSVSCEIESEWQEMVKKEVLAVEMGGEGNFEYDEIAKVNGEQVTLSLEKA